MKKLMTMIATVATAFGLFAAGEVDNGFIAGADFESGTSWVEKPGYLTWTSEGFTAGWWNAEVTNAEVVAEMTGSEVHPLAFGGSADEQVLKIGTTLGNPVLQYTSGDHEGVNIGDGLYFDGLVKFTLFDPGDEPTADGAKIAVYPQLTSDEDGAEAYLTVLAGSGDRFTTAQEIAADTWYRLTIKAIANIDGSENVGFMVFVNGSAVNSDSAIIQSGLLAKYAEWGKAGKIFRSMGSNATVSAVGFDGKGAVDEIVFTTTAPSFAVDPEGATVGWDIAKVAGISLTEDGELITVNPSFINMADLTDGIVYYKAKDGYVDGSITVKDGDSTTIGEDVADAVASVNGKGYETVAEASAAIVEGALFKFFKNTEAALEIKYENVTIDLGGKTITGDTTPVITVGSAASVIVSNGTITAETVALSEGTLDIEDGTYNGGFEFEGTFMINGGRFSVKLTGDITFPKGKTLVAGTGADAGYWVIGDAAKPGFIMSIVENAKPMYRLNALVGYTEWTEKVDVDPGTTVYWMYVAEDTEAADYYDFSDSATGEEIVNNDNVTVGEGLTCTKHVGAGTEADPFLVWGKDELTTLQGIVNGGTKQAGVFYKQVKDIELGAWSGIGGKKGATPFGGVYNGNGKTIAMTPVAGSWGTYLALFNAIDGATISNLTVNVSVTGPTSGELGCAAFVGWATGSFTLKDLTATGNIGSATAYMTHTCGGIAVSLNAAGTVENCTSSVDIWAKSDNTKVGGIVGIVQTAGGLTIKNCSNSGNLTASQNGGYCDGVGGIAGHINQNATIENCSNTGIIVDEDTGTGKDSFGQLVGNLVAGTLTLNGTNTGLDTMRAVGPSKVLDGVNFATVSSGVATYVKNADVVAGNSYKVMVAGAPAITLANLGDSITLDTTLAPSYKPVSGWKSGRGTLVNNAGVWTLAYDNMVYDADDLVYIKDQVAAGNLFTGVTITQMADVDMSSVTAFPGIGTYVEANKGTLYFDGIYDGNGMTISNVVLKAGKYTALFNQVAGTVKDLTVENVSYDTSSTTFGGAMVVCNLVGGTVDGVTTKGSFGSSDRPLSHNAAGIVCRAGAGVIKDCTNEAAIFGNYTKMAGILVLEQDKTIGDTLVTIEGCVNKGSITAIGNGADGCAGILAYAGNADKVTIKNCENTGVLTGVAGSKVGQIVGWEYTQIAFDGTIKGLDSIPFVGAFQDTTQTCDGLYFATVEGGVATGVKNAALVKDGTAIYTVMAPSAAVALAKNESITLDETLKAASVTSAVLGYQVTSVGETSAKTYSLEAITYAITYAYTTNDVPVAAADLADLKNDNPTTFTVEDAIVIDASKISLEGYEVKSVSSEGWIAGTFTADQEITVAFEKAANEAAPGGSPVKVKAATADDAIAQVTKKTVEPPAGAEVSTEDYNGYFELKAADLGGGSFNVWAALKDEIVQAAAETESLAGQLTEIAAKADGPAAVAITNAKPGLYYSVIQGQELGERTESARVLATGSSVTVPTVKYPGSGFYQIQVNASDGLQ